MSAHACVTWTTAFAAGGMLQMDQDRFDRIARALAAGATRRAGLRAALGGLLGVGAGMAVAAPDAHAAAKDRRKGRDRDRAGAAKRKHECGPDAPCPTGFDCVKQGRKRRCSCSTGITCDGACCPTGQVCQDGACAVPAACIAPGEPCKGVGKPCCDGRTCASGQGGRDDVACYVHKTGACQSTADCVYGTACLDGRCGFDVPPPAATGASCNMEIGQQCADPEATCTRYTGPGAPSGSYCTLPLTATCTGDPDCTCYRCDWTLGGVFADGERAPRAATWGPRLACCGPVGFACRSDKNCCLGTVCVNGTCQSETICDVCASGCPYTTIADAYNDAARFPDGSTITIAPGEYTIDSTVIDQDNARGITFRRCGVEGSAAIVTSSIMIRIQGLNTSPGGPISLVNLDFTGGDNVADVRGNGPDSRPWINVVGCSFRELSAVTWRRIRLYRQSDLVVAGSIFDGLSVSEEATAIWVDGQNSDPPTSVTIVRSTFSNLSTNNNAGAIKGNFGPVFDVTDSFFLDNYADNDGGAIYLNNRARMTAHNTVFRGNTAGDSQGDQGGAIYLDTNAVFHATGTTVITGNTSLAGSGIWCDETTAICAGMVSGVSTANVFGNGPGADCQTTSGPVSCDNWA